MLKWSQPFAEYYTTTIHPNIERLGALNLRQYGMDSATTNQSESFNSVLKRLQDWREVPVDVMVLSLFRLTQFYLYEVRRDRSGYGGFTRGA